MSDLISWEDQLLNLTAKGPASCPRVRRGLTCNIIRTTTWANPIKCECEIEKEVEETKRKIEKTIARKNHLSDIEFVNQNGRGK